MDLEKRRFTMIMWALCSFIVYYLILEFGWITTELSFWIYTAIYFVIFVVVCDLIMKPTKEERRRQNIGFGLWLLIYFIFKLI